MNTLTATNSTAVSEATRSFEKSCIAARYWLLGMAEHDSSYFSVLTAMEECLAHHNGYRNGGEPEASHQLGIFLNARTLHKHIKNPVMVYTLIFLHDIIEDSNQLTKAFYSPERVEELFGANVREKVMMLSKEVLGQRNHGYCLEAIFNDEDCSIVKGGDRCNNVSTMFGVFKPERLERYVTETMECFIPLLKVSRRKFPHQESVYENFKLDLLNQLKLISAIKDQK